MRKLLLIFVITTTFLYADDYKLGNGYKIDDMLIVGGYFSTDYKYSDSENRFRLDDIAVLAYGNLTHGFSYFAELEAAPFYIYSFDTKITKKDMTFHKERLYLNYSYSDKLNLRVGKSITPIGYWNLEPINVLRDTTSSPLYSNRLFPKFVTGIDMYGYLSESVKYHFFAQHNKDLDEEYINIKNDNYVGVALKNEVSFEFQYGGSVGQFITKDESKNRFVQLDFKYDTLNYMIQSEAMYVNVDSLKDSSSSYKNSVYIQGLYRLNEKNALVYRFEHFNESDINDIENISTFGYSYRPLYSVSLKGEYQYNTVSNLSNVMFSLSVLF